MNDHCEPIITVDMDAEKLALLASDLLATMHNEATRKFVVTNEPTIILAASRINALCDMLRQERSKQL